MKTNSGPSVLTLSILGIVALVIVILQLPAYLIAVGILCALAFVSFLNRREIEARERIRR